MRFAFTPSWTIPPIGSNQEIDIGGKTIIAVPGDGNGADDKVLNSLRVQ
jgi:hypothetical protein